MENKNRLAWKTKLLVGESLSPDKWRSIFLRLFNGDLRPEEAKALLVLLARKGEEAPEIWGCVQAIRRLEPPRRLRLPFLIDLCGTGGDRSSTFNISTVSSFVVASAGAYVAKHGNRAVSSKAGSSDLMEALGIHLDVPRARMLEALQRFHLGYFHAPFYHRTFLRIQGIRRELGIRTLFNSIGPLVNPVELPYQMIGVSDPRWLHPLAEGLRRVGRRRGAVVRSLDGMDELSTTAPNEILYFEGREMRKLRLDPRRFGFTKARKEDYRGGDPKTNREIALGILQNRLRGPCKEVVLLNSGFALWLTGMVSSIQEGIEGARRAIRTGEAFEILEALRRFTRGRNPR